LGSMGERDPALVHEPRRKCAVTEIQFHDLAFGMRLASKLEYRLLLPTTNGARALLRALR
jgi:phosphosulfolactate phosphohydrolase-like enzyme